MEDDDPGNSEAVRRLLERADEADTLRDQVDDLEACVEDLRNQLVLPLIPQSELNLVRIAVEAVVFEHKALGERTARPFVHV